MSEDDLTPDSPKKEEPEQETNIHEKVINTLVSKMKDKQFIRDFFSHEQGIDYKTPDKLLMYIETLYHHKGMHVDGYLSGDGYTMPACPKHGVSPIHFCLVGKRDPKTKKPAGKCHYFDGHDVAHGICKAPPGKRYVGEERLKYEEAFMIESKYRQKPKEILSDLSAISESAKAAQDAKRKDKKKSVRKAGAGDGKQQTGHLPGNPAPFKG